MLKKSERLTRADFLAFFKTGKRLHTDHLSVVYTSQASFHGAVIVSKKVAKLAVVRNQIRRRVYTELRNLRTLKPGVYIVTVKSGFVGLTKAGRKVELEKLIERIKKST